MGVFGTGVLLRLPPSLPEGLQLSKFLPLRCCPIARGVIDSYFQCWRKDRRELYCFGESPKTDVAEVGRACRR